MSAGARPPPGARWREKSKAKLDAEGVMALNKTLDNRDTSEALMQEDEPQEAARLRAYNRVKTLRRDCGLSREELAEAVEISPATLGNLEREDYEPSLALAWRIRDYFGLPLEVIFSTEPMPPLSEALYRANEREG